MARTNRRIKKTELPFEKSHAFIIGIDDYVHLDKLTTAVNDTKKLGEVLAAEQGFEVHYLFDASKKEIEALLKSTIIKKVGEDDRVLFYFAGHGIASQSDELPEGYIIPADAVKENVNSLISMKDLRDAVNMLPCLHVLLILDCCFAGAFKWSSRFRDSGTMVPKRIYKERFDRYVEDPARQVITSAAYDQYAVDILPGVPIGKRNDEDMPHSPFAEALFDGLNGAADIIPAEEGDGLITASELYLYLRHRVETKTIDTDERLRQTPLIFFLERHDKGEFIFLNPRHRLNLPRIPPREPYKGLLSYEEGDKELFYGRNSVIEELMKEVEKGNLIVVTGASGTGKSSVAKAGLIPELREKGYHILPVVRPGKTPVFTLGKMLRETTLFDYDISFAADMKVIARKLNSHQNVLFIDQFEELITQCHEPEDRDHFIRILKVLLDANRKNLLKIILTLRSDFEPHFYNSDLEKYWERASYKIPPLTVGELREVIVNPAIQEILFFDPPKLVDRIINDVAQEPGTLPLLSFTMSELYRLYCGSGRTNRELHEDDYEKLGGVFGALRTRADSLLNDLDQNGQNILRKILLRMVAIEGNELSGKKVLMRDLEFSEGENGSVEQVIAKLVKMRLILMDKDDDEQTYVEPAHDALIRCWPTLGKWIEDHGKDRIILQTKIGGAAKDYSLGKGKLWHDDSRLDVLKEELQAPDSCLNTHEKKFVEESIKLKKQKRNRFMITLVSIIIILSGLLIFAINKANEARKEARIALSNYYAAQARIILNKEPTTALRLAAAAYKLDQNDNVTQILSEAAALTLKHPLDNVNLHHNYSVNSAVFSPCGTRILTASEDKSAKLWDLQGRLLQDFKHQKAVTAAVFSPDGRALVSVSRDRKAKLWDLQGNLLQDFEHEKRVVSAVFSPDGRKILTASDDNTARVWDVRGKLLQVYNHKGDVNIARFSPDGSRILTVTNDRKAWLLDLRGTPLIGQYGVSSAAFSPDGKYIVFVLFNNTVKLWNLEDNTEKVFKGMVTPADSGKDKSHSQIIHLAVVSPDGSSILIAYLGGAVELRDLGGRILTSFSPHEDTLTSALFSPDGTRIITASKDSTVILWDLCGNLIADLHLHNDRIISAAFSPDGTCILTTSKDYTVKMWDLKDQLLTEFNTHKDEVKFADFSPDGTKVLGISVDNSVKLWDLRGNLGANLDKHTKTVHSATFSPDGTRILTASADNTAKLWDLEGNIITDFKLHTDNVNSAVFSPDGRFILTASYDDTAKLWDLRGKMLQSLNHQKGVISAQFSPGGKKILTASFDETAKLWDLRGNLLADFKKQYGQVKIAIFSPDGDNVLTLSASARLWHVNGQHLTEFNILKQIKGEMRIEENHFVNNAGFSPHRKRVLTVHNDNIARLWDFQGNLLTQLEHKAKIYSAEFSPDGTRIVTASADSTIRLWDLQGNLLAGFYNHEGDVYSAVFSPDGKRILSASADKTVKLWYTPEGIMQWLDAAQIPPFIPTKNSIQNYK